MKRVAWGDLASRPAFFPAVSLGLGAWLSGTTGQAYPAFLVAASGLGAWAVLRAGRTGSHLGLLLAFFCLGHALQTRAARVVVPSFDGEVALEGEVRASDPIDSARRVTLDVSRAAERPSRFKANVYVRGGPRWLAGQRVRLGARLKPLEQPSNPGQADLRQSLGRRGLVFTGGADGRAAVTLSRASAWRRWMDRTQQALADRARALAPTPEAAALYLTLAAGQRAELGPQLEASFARSGLAHVLSISGLHVAALALMLLKALRALAVRWGGRTTDARRWAAPACVPLLWGYVIFTGMQPPAVRSAVMATVLFAGMALWRRPDALNSLAWASLVLVAIDPGAVGDLSLQLSFLAVFSLVVLSPAVRSLLPRGVRPPGWRDKAMETFAASVAVTAASAPLIAAAFHRVSVAGLVSNIVCLPLCGVLTALSAGGAATFVLSPTAATPVLFAGGWASQVLLWAVRFFAAVPGASFAVPPPGPWVSLAYEAGLFAFAVGRGRIRWLGLAAPAAVLALAFSPPGMPVRVTFLSVGQGDSTVVSVQGHHALIDGGGVPGGADTGEKYVLPYLAERRIASLDLAVLSHPHPDHALGLISALRSVRTRRLWMPPGEDEDLTRQVVEAAGIPPERVFAGSTRMQLGGATIQVLGPPGRTEGWSTNDASVVLRLTYGAVSFLLTGDIEATGEAALRVTPVTVMKAPHHGSKTSSSPALLEAAKPRFVVFCVGLNNRFNFPAEEVVARYQSVGAKCYRTDLDGAIEFATDGERVEAKTFY